MSYTFDTKDMDCHKFEQGWRGWLFHPLTIVEMSRKKGFWELCNFLIANDPHSNRSLDRIKNSYPLRNHTIPNSAATRVRASTWSVDLWFPDPEGFLIGNYAICQQVWILPIESPRKFVLEYKLHKYTPKQDSI